MAVGIGLVRVNVGLGVLVITHFESLLEYVQQPCDREIFWIVGKEGNEGKNWFQKYMKSWLGARRVVTGIDIKANSASIFQALISIPYTTTSKTC